MIIDIIGGLDNPSLSPPLPPPPSLFATTHREQSLGGRDESGE